MPARNYPASLGRSKFDKSDTEGPKWWDRYLTEVEAEIIKPSIERPEEVFAVIRERPVFRLVSAILGLDEAKCDHLCVLDEQEPRQQASAALSTSFEASTSEGSILDTSSETSSASSRSHEDDKEDSELDICLSSSSKTVDTSEEIQDRSEGMGKDAARGYDSYTNPYLRFLRTPKERAATWRPRPRPVPTGIYQADPRLKLEEKADIVANKIASDFCSWMRELGGRTPLDEQMLIELFEFVFDKPAAHALTNRIRELPTVTATMAKRLRVPQVEQCLYVREEIQRDIDAERAKPRTRGFGSALPSGERVEPPRNRTEVQWRGFRPPSALASFATAFEDLAHLESYIGFCNHLALNPDLRRPDCMKTWGTFEARPLAREAPSSTLDLELEMSLNAAVEPSLASLTVESSEEVS